MERNTYSLLASWSTEFESTKERVRSLIGDAHWLSDGKYKEQILTNFLEKHSLGSLIFSTGFVVPLTNHSPSGEIDVLISKPNSGIPLLIEKELLIIPPEMAKGIIEVKSTYSKRILSDAMKSICKSYQAISYNGEQDHRNFEVWSSIFFFHESTSKTNDIKSIVDDVIDIARDIDLENLPNSIHIAPSTSILLNKTTGKVKGMINPELSSAVLLVEMHEAIEGKNDTGIGNYLLELTPSNTFTKNIQGNTI
ncbi:MULTISPECIES: DUF6602 domain-containing protein [Thalassolituus]|uniref:DUF6602 domain-containing protein n=1 Tax=Thalassolituus TaxID=187492 RepID=UPI002649E1F6|nr:MULTISPECIES: DUF6602 domain-containing protein [Thalassolituus]|tara:strand:+ start:6835 stop:7590 length:756 start_codon:yes stop_codon:yes gene_type:complete